MKVFVVSKYYNSTSNRVVGVAATFEQAVEMAMTVGGLRKDQVAAFTKPQSDEEGPDGWKYASETGEGVTIDRVAFVEDDNKFTPGDVAIVTDGWKIGSTVTIAGPPIHCVLYPVKSHYDDDWILNQNILKHADHR